MRSLPIVLALALSLILSSIALAGPDVPDLTGTWNGVPQGHSKDYGFASLPGGGKLVISEQKGQVFTGQKVWSRGDKERHEAFSGAVSPEGDVYLAEEVDGIAIGKLTNGTLTVYYLEPGAHHKALVIVYTKQ